MTDTTDADSMFNRSSIMPEYEYVAIQGDADSIGNQPQAQDAPAYDRPHRPPTSKKFRKDNQLYIPFLKTASTLFFGKRRREAFFENERKLKESKTENRLFIRVYRDAEIRTGKQIRRADITRKLFALAAIGLTAKAASGDLPGMNSESPAARRRLDTTLPSTASTNPNSRFAPSPTTSPEATVESTVPALPATTTSIKTPESTTTIQPAEVTFSAGGLTCRGIWSAVTMEEVDRGSWFRAAKRVSRDKDLWPDLNKERADIIWPEIQKHEQNQQHGGTIPAAVGATAMFPTVCEPWKLPGE